MPRPARPMLNQVRMQKSKPAVGRWPMHKSYHDYYQITLLYSWTPSLILRGTVHPQSQSKKCQINKWIGATRRQPFLFSSSSSLFLSSSFFLLLFSFFFFLTLALLVSSLVFWAKSTTKGYIMVKNNVQSGSYLLCTQVIKPQIIHKPQNQSWHKFT